MTFGEILSKYFTKYLADEKGLSENTIKSYATCMMLFVKYCINELKKSLDEFNINEVDEKTILSFLDYLENERGNIPVTRNQRLKAMCVFFEFLTRDDPKMLHVYEKIKRIKLKKVEQKEAEVLDDNEVQAFLQAAQLQKDEIDNVWEARDLALFLMLYHTGARAQEIADMKIADLRLEKPHQIKIIGKGRKERRTPMLEDTTKVIKRYLSIREHEGINSEYLFINKQRDQITRFGILYIVGKYKKIAEKICPSLETKKISPHTFRHTAATHMLQAGVGLPETQRWLGHADINTTNHYVKINMQMKQEALEKWNPDGASSLKTKSKWKDKNILDYLRGLTA